jgi:hypothetical protein
MVCLHPQKVSILVAVLVLIGCVLAQEEDSDDEFTLDGDRPISDPAHLPEAAYIEAGYVDWLGQEMAVAAGHYLFLGNNTTDGLNITFVKNATGLYTG